MCQKGSTTVSCRWPNIYAQNVDTNSLTVNGSAVTIPTGGSTTPLMNGTGAAGSSANFARADHVHPSDTSRVATTTTVNGHALTGNVTVTAADLGAGAVAAGVTVPWGQVTGQPSSMHMVSGTMIGPSSGVAGNGADQNMFSVAVPAGTFAVGTGIHCSAQWTNSASVATSYKWTLGSTLLATQSVTTSSTNFYTDIEIYTPSSLTGEVAWVAPIVAGTAIQAGAQVGLTAAENLGSASTLKITFNTTSGDTITPKTFHCNTIQ